MKNIFIINQQSRSSNYGIGTYTRQLTDALRELPVHLYVVNLNASGIDEIVKEDKEEVCFITIPAARHAPDPFNKNYDRYQRNVYYILRRYITNNRENLFFFNAIHLRKLCELLRIDTKCVIVLIVHCMGWSFTLLGDIRQMRKILNSSHMAGNPIRKSFENEQYCMRELADHIIAIAWHSYNTIRMLYKIPTRKITLIPNGLKDSYERRGKKEKATIREKYHIGKKEKILIFAGRLDPVKGVGFMIEAFKVLAEKNPHVRLFIVGDGSLTTLMDVANPYWTRITFTGYLQQEQLFELYAIADIGVIPSLHEEFGYVAIEMMMHGLPVIVNNTTGLKEIVENGVNGSYIHIQTEQDKAGVVKNEISQVYSRLLNDNVTRKKYGKAGRALYLKNYNIGVFKKNINCFYKYIIDI